MRRRRGAGRWAWFGLAVLGLVVTPHLLTPFQQGFLTEILIWSLLAVAFNLIYGFAGLMSLGHSIFFGAGAYGIAWSVLRFGFGLWVSILLALCLSLLVAYAIGFFAVRVREHGFIIATVVAAGIITMIANRAVPLTGGDDGLPFALPPLRLFGADFSLVDRMTRYYFVLAFVVVVYALYWRLIHSPLGRVFVLIRDNEERVWFIGYDADRYKCLSFVISGGIAGLSGLLYALHTRYASSEFFQWTVSAEAIVWTLFGGAGTLMGPILGTGILLVFKEWLSRTFVHTYPIFLGAIIILVVLFAPNGLVGVVRQVAERWKEKAAAAVGLGAVKT